MCIIRRDHKALRKGHQITFLISAKGQIDPEQHILKKCGCCSLFCGTPHLFVIQYTVDCNIFLFICLKKTFQRSESTLQIIQPWTGNKLIPGTPDRSGHPVIKKQIMSQNILRPNLRLFCHHPHEISFFTTATVQWKHIFLNIVMIASVDIPVHMDGKAWDHDQISVNIHKFFQDFSVLADDHPACNRKGTVKPGRQDHSSVPLHIQFHVSSVYGHLRIFFYFKRRRIAVACNDMISSAVIDRNGKSNDGGMISHDKIFSAFSQVPAFLLFQFCKALLQKTFSCLFCRLKGCGAFADKFQQFLCCLFVHSISPLSGPYHRSVLLLPIIRQIFFQSNTFTQAPEISRIPQEVSGLNIT